MDFLVENLFRFYKALSNQSRYLPIIFNIREAKIAGSYHKILGLTRAGDTMAVS
jgi:hypothetical protein